jgi:hypothetical protein
MYVVQATTFICNQLLAVTGNRTRVSGKSQRMTSPVFLALLCCGVVSPQGKLTALEDTHAAVLASYREGQAALEAARGEAARLGREAGQLAGLVEKLEDRYACSSVVFGLCSCCYCWQFGEGAGRSAGGGWPAGTGGGPAGRLGGKA